MATKVFSISEMAHLTGIRPHTLRIWEQRYGFPVPERSKGNIRAYPVSGLARLLHAVLLTKWGHRIAGVARMSGPELEAAVVALPGADGQKARIHLGLLLTMHQLDVERFEALLQEAALRFSSSELVDEIIYPFLQKTGLLYQGQRLTEEHLVVGVLRKRLHLAIDSLPAVAGGQLVLLFLRDLRLLDLGLLYTQYQLRRCGLSAINLGNDISIPNLRAFCATRSIVYLFTYLAEKTRSFPKDLSQFMTELGPGSTLLYVSGSFIEAGGSNIHRVAIREAVSRMCDDVPNPRVAAS